MLVFLLQILINRELRQKRVYATVAVMTVLLTVIYMLYDDYSDIITFIVNMGLLAFLRRKKYFIVTSLTATLAYILFSFFGNYATESIFHLFNLGLNDWSGWLFEAIGETIVTACMLAVAASFKVLKKRYPRQFVDGLTLNVIVSALAVVAVAFFTITTAADNYNIGSGFLGILMLILVAILLINAGTFLYLFYSYTLRVQNNRQALERQQYDIYVKNLENSYQNLRKFRHDYQNILLSLGEYIQTADDPELQQYFRQVVTKSKQSLNRDFGHFDNLEQIKDKPLKAIIQSKFSVARQAGIQVRLEANDPIAAIAIDSVTLSRVSGILLDNAIEAVKGQSGGQIAVALVKYPHMVELIFANSLNHPIERLDELMVAGHTSKGAGHGQGLATVRELLDPLANVTYEVSSHQRFEFIISIESE
ncbi:sensor histidine kinase [Lactiplantibacillus plantarum]|uniref:sensor histidine kinase n=1 Tax=Lactiplantibacillus plantarum TaxID=1590 RepID=UPI001F4CF886|nr:GHKL domain-containing protein [Lactiplantibacillus plantarum]MCH8625233.1 GHKL domain-containing protein [Lactiplantibacillus plantarum]MCH8631870.1 GHKL domain-containing protein [Lactiplantibacillus plantarum]MCH8634873.1 GHKL domain-containing protein [Lactiplantibacillus plantarum]